MAISPLINLFVSCSRYITNNNDSTAFGQMLIAKNRNKENQTIFVILLTIQAADQLSRSGILTAHPVVFGIERL